MFPSVVFLYRLYRFGVYELWSVGSYRLVLLMVFSPLFLYRSRPP